MSVLTDKCTAPYGYKALEEGLREYYERFPVYVLGLGSRCS